MVKVDDRIYKRCQWREVRSHNLEEIQSGDYSSEYESFLEQGTSACGLCVFWRSSVRPKVMTVT